MAKVLKASANWVDLNPSKAPRNNAANGATPFTRNERLFYPEMIAIFYQVNL
ncbi:hypothetical protein ACTWKA_13185 [Bacillus sp. 3A_MP1]